VTAVRLDASLAQLRGLLEGKGHHGLA
jgi:hypothetical protein